MKLTDLFEAADFNANLLVGVGDKPRYGSMHADGSDYPDVMDIYLISDVPAITKRQFKRLYELSFFDMFMSNGSLPNDIIVAPLNTLDDKNRDKWISDMKGETNNYDLEFGAKEKYRFVTWREFVPLTVRWWEGVEEEDDFDE